MNTDLSLVTLLIPSAAIIIAAVALARSKHAASYSLLALALSIAALSIAYLIRKADARLSDDLFLISVLYLGMLAAAGCLFSFAIYYTNRFSGKLPRTLAALVLFPVLTQILYWIEPTRRLLFSSPAAGVYGAWLTGPWSIVTAIYIYSMAGAGYLLIWNTMRRKPRGLLVSSWSIPAGALSPFIAQGLLLIGIQPGDPMEVILVGFTLAGIGFAYGLFSHKPIETAPIMRDVVVEGMSEGWMVLNARNNIVDLNPAAERMVGMTREKAYGQPISSVLGDISSLGNTFEGTKELEMKRSFKSQEGGWRYLNIRISPLIDSTKIPFGHLVSWRDNTERRMAEDARQRARDEMFVLLNAISSEASESMSLEEFLTESIFQIIYPFRSQVVAIFITDDKKDSGNEHKFFLSAHFGLSDDAVKSMPYLSMNSPLVGPVMDSRQALLVDHPADEVQLPPALRNAGLACMLVVPLATQEGDEHKILGCICFGRKEKPVYSQDEVVRIITISDHLANLIDSDRRRKLAISLSERQRLMRDLHDSVSQKLYGLVTLTEAGQAALEAGTRIDPAQVLSRIGDNARQAVKEMRLFLYQMQPIDLENESLISILHHRLSAVEGRADMKARLLADENISLSTEKEVALFYIAQEALNNILKHAHAKNVLVTLKQGRKNVILEIRDDGCGFDPKEIDHAGLGLANMGERVSKIKGKFKLNSKPGAGTSVVVTVARDNPVIPARNRR